MCPFPALPVIPIASIRVCILGVLLCQVFAVLILNAFACACLFLCQVVSGYCSLRCTAKSDQKRNRLELA